MRVSLRGDSAGSLGLTRSSTVTAAMALMLVEAVLGRGQAAALSPDAGSLRGCGGKAPFCGELWGALGARGAPSSPEGPAVGTGQEQPRHPRGRLEDIKDQVGHVLRGEMAAWGGDRTPGDPSHCSGAEKGTQRSVPSSPLSLPPRCPQFAAREGRSGT